MEQTITKGKRKHFHTFDALRFISFFLVFLHHLPKSEWETIAAFQRSGGIGVCFFFVLSGFLITYILLFEKEKRHTISLKKFFVRRILRIWPLFYAMILFAFLTPYLLNVFGLSATNDGYQPNWLVSVLFGENYMMMYTDSFPDRAPLRVMWSLCIEEHFYIIWGILLYCFSKVSLPNIIIASILLANIIRIIYSYLGIPALDIFTYIDYFAYGAIPAYLLMTKSTVLEKTSKIPMINKYLLVLFTISFVFIFPNLDIQNVVIKNIIPNVFGILFSIVILFTLSNSNYLHIKNNTLISKLGKYTYSLYLVHTIVILLLIQISKHISFLGNWFAFSLIALILTIIVSIISYEIFEKQFLKLKKYFY